MEAADFEPAAQDHEVVRARMSVTVEIVFVGEANEQGHGGECSAPGRA
jgi:hypothetical protein